MWWWQAYLTASLSWWNESSTWWALKICGPLVHICLWIRSGCFRLFKSVYSEALNVDPLDPPYRYGKMIASENKRAEILYHAQVHGVNMGMVQEGPQKEFNREIHQSQPTNTFLAFLHRSVQWSITATETWAWKQPEWSSLIFCLVWSNLLDTSTSTCTLLESPWLPPLAETTSCKRHLHFISVRNFLFIVIWNSSLRAVIVKSFLL